MSSLALNSANERTPVPDVPAGDRTGRHPSQPGLVAISTHPVQYHAPVLREVQRRGIPTTAIYGSDFSVAGYQDREFGVAFSWDTDLLSGYSAQFLSRVAEGGATSADLTSPRGLPRALREARPRAVLLMGYTGAFQRGAVLEVMRRRTPVLFRAETTDHARVRGSLDTWVRDTVLRAFYARCDRLLYIGQRSREHYERLGCPPGKLVFSPYCVDTSAFECGEDARAAYRDQVRAELGLPENCFTLLFSGKLVPRKGPDLLCDAVASAARATPDRPLGLIFVGDGEMRATLANRGAPAETRFVGFHNQRALSRYFHAADALVLPSRFSETWGLVVNEALHHGLPCIVSDQVGSAPDLVTSGHTGEVFQGGSVEDLKAAIMRVREWAGPSLGVRGACRARVAAYTVAHAADGIVEAYGAATETGLPAERAA